MFFLQPGQMKTGQRTKRSCCCKYIFVMFIKNINPCQSSNETVPFYSGIMRFKFHKVCF